MIIVDVKKERNLESALKKYKFKVQKTKQTEKLRNRQQFVKPSVAKRSKKLKAIYKQQVISDQEKSN
jgi:small subunit ribosomal protein S21